MKANDEAVVHGSDFPDYLTPWDMVQALRDEFRFDLDLAADANSSIVHRWLGPDGLVDDALAHDWYSMISAGYGMGFLNPPWSRERKMPIEPWLKKAVEEANHGFTTVMVVPHRPDTRWWRLTQHAAEIREIPHRVKYLLPPSAFLARNAEREAAGKTPLKGKLVHHGCREAYETSGAGFPTALLLFRPQPGIIAPALPRRVTWDYLKHTKRSA